MTFSLSIYHISVNPRRKKDERYILSDIEGQNLYDLTDQFLTSWLIQINGVHKSDKFQKATRIGKDEGNPIYFPNGEQIYGIIESGEFGQEMDVVNVDDGSLCHTITAEEAPMFPFFFLFYLPADSRDGFLILQKNGNVGIQSILASEYLNFLKNHLNADCTIKIQSFALHELINKNLNNISEAKAIILKNRGLKYFQFKLGDRFLPFLPILFLMGALVINQLIGAWATYLRCHKKEPFLMISIVSGILCCLSTVLLGRFYGVDGMTAGYFTITFVLSFWGYHIYKTCKYKWHSINNFKSL